MKQSYRVKENLPFFKELKAYFRKKETMLAQIRAFLKQNKIQSTKFCPDPNYVIIIPTEKDMTNFQNQFTGQIYVDGLRRFKETSPIGKYYKEYSKTCIVFAKKPKLMEFPNPVRVGYLKRDKNTFIVRLEGATLPSELPDFLMPVQE